MFGDLSAKLTGLRHIYVNYVTGVPDQVELYQPYRNRECLSCHRGARSFEELDFHIDIRPELDLEEFSCLECHTLTHDIAELSTLEMWEPGP